MVNSSKREKLAQFTKMIEKKSLVFIDYRGINVEDFEHLRDDLRKEGGKVKVFKNNLVKRALAELELKFDESFFTGMIATTIMNQEQFVSSGKSILKAEKGEKIVIRGGIFEGEQLSPDEVRRYASLMSKEELYGVLVGCLKGIVSKLVFVLDEICSKKESGVEASKVGGSESGSTEVSSSKVGKEKGLEITTKKEIGSSEGQSAKESD